MPTFSVDLFEKVKDMSTEEIMKSLSNEERFNLCNLILETDHPEVLSGESKIGCYKAPPVSFIFQSGNFFIGVDNRTHECWMEAFKSEAKALAWTIDPKGA